MRPPMMLPARSKGRLTHYQFRAALTFRSGGGCCALAAWRAVDGQRVSPVQRSRLHWRRDGRRGGRWRCGRKSGRSRGQIVRRGAGGCSVFNLKSTTLTSSLDAGIGQQDDAITADGIADHGSDRKAGRQQAAVAGTDDLRARLQRRRVARADRATARRYCRRP